MTQSSTQRTPLAKSGRGGYRPGAGRPPNATNKLSREAREKALATGDGMLPHEFLLKIVRGEPIFRKEVHPVTGQEVVIQEQYDFEARKDAAKAAAPYYAPKISTVEVISGVSDNELDSIIARAAAEAGISLGTGGEGEEGEAAQSKPSAGEPTRRRVLLD